MANLYFADFGLDPSWCLENTTWASSAITLSATKLTSQTAPHLYEWYIKVGKYTRDLSRKGCPVHSFVGGEVGKFKTMIRVLSWDYTKDFWMSQNVLNMFNSKENKSQNYHILYPTRIQSLYCPVPTWPRYWDLNDVTLTMVVQIQTLYRVAEVGSLSARAKMVIQIFVKRVLTIFATNASFLRVFAHLQI